MTDFELRVGQTKYGGWKSLKITRSIEELAHSFDVNLTDRWNANADPIPVEAGDACSILIDGEVITTGYIDEDTLDYDESSRSLTFSGRSKTSDLVDCAAVYEKGQWLNTGLLQIAKDLCEPFGITASTNVSLGENFSPPNNFKIQEGETAFECLSRGARARGVLMLTDKDGNLVFDRAGSSKVTTVLERGKNILRGGKKNSWRDRFATYTIKAQSPGNDERYGNNATLSRTSTDPFVTGYRPTVIMADSEASGTELQKRVDWERNVRAGQSRRLSYTVQGWEHVNGLWEPNTLIRVKDPDARVDDELLAVSVTQSRDQGGTLTSIDLTIKEAYDVQSLPTPKSKDGAL